MPLKKKFSPFKAHILIVDDKEFSREFLRGIFEHHGFANIALAGDAMEAIKYVQHQVPDLIILDIVMPEIDGLELCKILQKNPMLANTVIIMQTASDEEGYASKAFRAGASDFIRRPINADELVMRTIAHLERGALTRQLKVYQERLSKEMQSAREMQHAILPSESAMKLAKEAFDIDIAYKFEPCDEIGGDFWGIKKLTHDRLALYCVDISGHGVTAALNAFRLHVLIHQMVDEVQSPAEFLNRLNNTLKDILATGQFAAIFFGIYHWKQKRLDYAGGGMIPPMVYDKSKKVAQVLPYSGMPLAAIRNIEYDEYSTTFSEGSALMFFSDALVETPDSNDNFLTDDALLGMLEQYGARPAREILDAALALYAPFKGDNPVPDDFTLAVMKFE